MRPDLAYQAFSCPVADIQTSSVALMSGLAVRYKTQSLVTLCDLSRTVTRCPIDVNVDVNTPLAHNMRTHNQVGCGFAKLVHVSQTAMAY